VSPFRAFSTILADRRFCLVTPGQKANFGLKKVHKYLFKKRPPIASNDRRARSLCALELDSFT
jgi:hypothetical protein